MIRKLVILIFLSLGLFLSAALPIFSQSTPEQLEIQKRLNEVESKRATSSVTTSAKKQGSVISFIEGGVISASNGVLFISTRSGTKIIYTSDSTKFLNLSTSGKKLIGFGDLKIGETILIMGVPEDSATGMAKLVVRDQNQKLKFFSVLGKISEITETTLTLKDWQRTDLPTLKIAITASTTVMKGNTTITFSKLKPDDQLTVTGTIDDKGNPVASNILVF